MRSPSSWSPWRRRLTVLWVLLIGLLLLITFALPPWLRGRIESAGSEALGRELKLQSLSLAPWRLGATLEGLRIAGAAGQGGDLLQIERIDAALALSSVWKGAIVLRRLEIEHPQLRLERDAAGRLSIDDLLRRFSKPKPAGDASPQWALYNLRLNHGEARFADQGSGQSGALQELALGLPFLSNRDDDIAVEVQPHLSGRWQGQPFDLSGQTLPWARQPQAELKIEWSGLDLAGLARWLPLPGGATIEQGQLGGQLRLHFKQAPKAKPELRLQGELQLRDVAATAPGARFKLARAGVSIEALEPLQGRASLKLLTLEQAGGEWSPPGLPPLRLQDLQLRLEQLQWPLASAPATLKLQAQVHDAKDQRLGGVNLEARLEAAALEADLKLAPLQPAALLAWAQPPALRGLRLDGVIEAQAHVRLEQPLLDDPLSRVQLAQGGLQWRDGLLNSGPLWPAGQLKLEGGQVELVGLAWQGDQARQLQFESLALQGKRLALHRHKPAPAGPSGGASKPWKVALGELKLNLAQIQWRDDLAPALRAAEQPVQPTQWEARELQLGAQKLHWDGQALASSPWTLGLRSGPRQNPAQLHWQGSLGSSGAEGRLKLTRWPLAVADAYLPESLGLGLRDALLGGDLQVRADAQAVQLRGAADLQSMDLVLVQGSGSERVMDQPLLAWQGLAASGLDLNWPLTAGAAPRVQAGELLLQGLRAHLLVDEQGVLRLQGRVGKGEVADQPPPRDPAAPKPQLALGKVRLENAEIDFEDRFVKPSYRAQISRLSGELGSLRSDATALAPLSLKGVVAGTGALLIEGQLNPFLKPPQLELRAEASNIELAPFSPYSGKFLGYGIERGKLTSKLQYRIGADGKLQAENQFILNQLTLGEKVESPQATGLPVRLALALLADRHGVIDIQLPIEGSLEDPEFRIGALVWKLIGRLIVKAVSSPFAWIGSGGAEGEPARLVFAAGSSQLPAGDGLDRVAEALRDKPGLQLTLTGSADLAAEREALARLRIEAALAQAWSRERGQAGSGPQTPPATDRLRLLRQIYEARPLPGKPRNFIGLQQAQTEAQMLERLGAAEAIGEEQMRALALARATAVRDALAARGLPLERLFLAAPRLRATDAAAWQPHVELGLAMP